MLGKTTQTLRFVYFRLGKERQPQRADAFVYWFSKSTQKKQYAGAIHLAPAAENIPHCLFS